MIKTINQSIKSFLNILGIFPNVWKLNTIRNKSSIEAEICADINKTIMRIEKNNAKREKNLQN